MVNPFVLFSTVVALTILNCSNLCAQPSELKEVIESMSRSVATGDLTALRDKLGELPEFDASAVDELKRALGSDDKSARVSALLILEKYGDAAAGAAEALRDALDDKDPDIRVLSMEALDEVDPDWIESSIDFLVGATADRDARVAARALYELSMLGPLAKKALPDVLLVLKQSAISNSIRRMAIQAAVEIDPDCPAVVTALRETLRSDTPGISIWAAQALGTCGRAAQGAVPDLLNYLKVGSGGQETVIRAIGEIGPEAESALEPLLGYLDDPVRASAAIVAIGQIGKSSPKVTNVMLTFIRGSDHAICAAALNTLRAVQDESAEVAEVAADLCENTEHEPVRIEALAFLGSMSEPTDRARGLIRSHLESENMTLRAIACVSSLELNEHRRFSELQLESLLKHDDTAVLNGFRRVRLAAPTIDGILLPRIRKLLESDAENQRKLAVEALGIVGSESMRARTLLTKALADPSDTIRIRTAFLLLQVGRMDPTVVVALQQRKDDPDFGVRRAAARVTRNCE